MLRAASLFFLWLSALAGCGGPGQPPVEDNAAAETSPAQDEARGVAEAALGKSAEILANGDLAQNGRQQLLVVNRVPAAAQGGTGSAGPQTVVVTRAAVLEKDGGKWSQILLCDEHLKNTRGYLGGSGAARVSGWRLEYHEDFQSGLNLKLTPLEQAGGAEAEEGSGKKSGGFDVRWNKNAQRYQTFDKSQGGYLAEVPSLETPVSTLK